MISAKKNAIKMGAKKVIVEDLKNTFAKDYIFPMFRANTLYEGNYLLGTAIARPLIAKKQIENPTNNIPKTLFIMMMLSGDV